MVECRIVEEKLDDYLHNKLDADEAAEVLRHLTRCTRCRRTYEEMRGLSELIARAWQNEVEHETETVEVKGLVRTRRSMGRFAVVARIAAIFMAGLLVGGAAVALAFPGRNQVTPAYGTNMILTDVPGTIENTQFQEAGLRLVAEGTVHGIRAMALAEQGVFAGINGNLVLTDRTQKVVYGRPTPEMVAIDGLIGLADGGVMGYGRSRTLVRISGDQVEVLGAPRLKNGQFVTGFYTDGTLLYVVDQAGYYHRYDPEENTFTQGSRIPQEAVYDGVDPAAFSEAIIDSLENEIGAADCHHACAVFDEQGNEVTYALIEFCQSFLFDKEVMKFKNIAQGTWEETFTPKVVAGEKVYGFVGEELAYYDLTNGNLQTICHIGVQGPMVKVGESIYIFSLSTHRYDLGRGELYDLNQRAYGLLPDSPAVVGPDGRIYLGGHYLGNLYSFDPKAEELTSYGRPLPELAPEAGEEVAPIEGLAFSPDGTLYGVIGTGAAMTGSSHLFRFDPVRGQIIDSFEINAPLTKLATGEGDFLYTAMNQKIGLLFTNR